MSTENKQIQELEDNEFYYWKDLKESLDRLEKNKDFKKVILDAYFKDRAINQVSLLAVPQIREQGKRSYIMEELVAISQLQDFFKVIKYMGSDSTQNTDEDSNSNEKIED